MEIRITPLRLGILLGCLVIFSFADGFVSPRSVASDPAVISTRTTRAWFYTIAIFVTGAVLASVVDHEIGVMDPTNIRFVYIITGIVLMIVAVYWGNALRESVP